MILLLIDEIKDFFTFSFLFRFQFLYFLEIFEYSPLPLMFLLLPNHKQILSVVLFGNFGKIKDPLITVSSSMTITGLWAMACWASIFVGIPEL
jgi:hypothetical protein